MGWALSVMEASPMTASRVTASRPQLCLVTGNQSDMAMAKMVTMRTKKELSLDGERGRVVFDLKATVWCHAALHP